MFAGVFAMAILSSLAFAQNKGGYKKGEFYFGYSNNQVDTGLDPDDTLDGLLAERVTYHGFEVAGVYNLNRYFGLKGDVSGGWNHTNFRVSTPGGDLAFKTKSSLYSFLGGVQVKDNLSGRRLKPFAHALFGVGHSKINLTNVSCPAGVDCSDLIGSDSETAFSAALGVGIDIKLSDQVDLRAIQVDYNPTRFGDSMQHNVRFGVGLVFK